MMTNKKIKTQYYDIVISIGQNCFVSRILRALNYRLFACPLDWVLVYNYTYSMELLKNKFENYFNKEDLSFVAVNEKWNTDVYFNNRNKTTFIHDFLKNSKNNFNEAYNKSKVKHKRRIKRLVEKLQKGVNVCLVYIEWQPGAEKNQIITNEIINNDIKELNAIYKRCNFDILYIKHNENLDINQYTINNRICELNNTPTNDELGNINLATKIIKKRVRLKFFSKLNPYFHKIKRVIKLCKIIN